MTRISQEGDLPCRAINTRGVPASLSGMTFDQIYSTELDEGPIDFLRGRRIDFKCNRSKNNANSGSLFSRLLSRCFGIAGQSFGGAFGETPRSLFRLR